VFKYFAPDFISQYKPEIDAVLHGLIFKYTIFSDIPTPANKLWNLKYRNEAHPLIAQSDTPVGVSSGLISRHDSMIADPQTKLIPYPALIFRLALPDFAVVYKLASWQKFGYGFFSILFKRLLARDSRFFIINWYKFYSVFSLKKKI